MYQIGRLRMYLIVLCGLTLQLSLFPFIESVSFFRPVPLCIIFIGLYAGVRPGFESGIVAGYLLDVFSGVFFGVNAVSLLLVGIFTGMVSTKIYRENIVAELLFVFLSLVAISACWLLFFKIYGRRETFEAIFLYLKLHEIILVTVLSVPFFWILRKFCGKTIGVSQ